MRKAGSGGASPRKKTTKVKYVKARGDVGSSKVGGGGGGAGSKSKKKYVKGMGPEQLPKYGTPGNPSAGAARAHSRSASRSRGGEPLLESLKTMIKVSKVSKRVKRVAKG